MSSARVERTFMKSLPQENRRFRRQTLAWIDTLDSGTELRLNLHLNLEAKRNQPKTRHHKGTLLRARKLLRALARRPCFRRSSRLRSTGSSLTSWLALQFYKFTGRIIAFTAYAQSRSLVWRTNFEQKKGKSEKWSEGRYDEWIKRDEKANAKFD